MVGKCANDFCATPRKQSEGKMFRVDVDLGNSAGQSELKTAYLWLCPRCAVTLIPKIEVAGQTVKVRLSKISCVPLIDNAFSSNPVN